MARYSKRGKRLGRPPKVRATMEIPAPVSRANYGSAETRRVCPRCGSLASSVSKTHRGRYMAPPREIVRRQRICGHCGKSWATVEVIAIDN